ncbi:alpha/beta hydrolase (plasmid) [Haladaptatus sp. SPP-AMP-3]|uniref:alpha/beta hydrolase n=1 Tax=Haladaptatus sp. SPP-AMP-3 TaxID=3121295 RepID=UPI003C2CDD1E
MVESGLRRLTSRRWKVGVGILLALILIVVGGVAVYFSLPHHGTSASVQSVANDPHVSISKTDGVTVLSPTNGTSTVGLVFYPGARVAPDAYYASLAPLVRRANVTVFVPKMPFNVALLDVGAAGEVRSRYSGIRTWFVGGHSLGGVAACRYASSHDVRGLVQFASYCDTNVSERPIDVLTVSGSRDTVLDREAYRESRNLLPQNATFREITGMNHTEFGSYRGQQGDSRATISYAVAHRRLADILVPWLSKSVTATA